MIKVQFLVTIEGDWMMNDKPVTAFQIEKDLRKAAKEEFEFLAKKVTVTMSKIQKVG